MSIFFFFFVNLIGCKITSSDGLMADVTETNTETETDSRSNKLSGIVMPGLSISLLACFCFFFMWILSMTGNHSTVWINFFLNFVTLRLSNAILS